MRLLRSLVGWGFRLTARHRHNTCPDLIVKQPPPGTDKPVIVMLHGFQGVPAEFCHLHAYLVHTLGEYFDFALVDTLDPSADLSPDENVQRLEEYLVAHNLKSRELYIIGHSMGGLVARRFPHLVQDQVVRAIILVATPNGGVNGWNLLPIHWLRSRGFHERVNLCAPAQAHINYMLLAGTKGGNFLEGQLNDSVVGLWSVMHFAECNAAQAEVETHIYPLDHWGLLRNKHVAHDIEAFLRTVYNKS